MTVEFKGIQPLGEADGVEHSAAARAKRVIPGALAVPCDGSVSRTVSPIQANVSGTSVSLSLDVNKFYRVIASVDCYIRLSIGANTAVIGDIFLPAKQETAIVTKPFDTLSAIAVSTSGFIQAVEVK